MDGFKKIYEKQVVHRDLKLANILVHFPNDNLWPRQIKNLEERKAFQKERLKAVNLEESGMCIKIADLGFAREL